MQPKHSGTNTMMHFLRMGRSSAQVDLLHFQSMNVTVIIFAVSRDLMKYPKSPDERGV